MCSDAPKRQEVPIGSYVARSQYGLNSVSARNGNVPIIGMKDMTAGKITANAWARTHVDESQLPEYLLRKGDILLNRTNSPDLVGKVSLWDREEEAVFASYLVRFQFDADHALPEFVNHYLNWEDSQQRLKQISTRGVSQANINPTTFQNHFMVAWPPLTEQRRIAAVLDEWDNAIAAAEKLLEANRHRKDAIRHALFGCNLRFGNYSGEWNPIPLADLLRVRGETSVGGETVYSVSVSRGLVDQVEHLGRSFSAANTHNYNRVCFGDVVYTKSPTGSFPLGVVKQSHVDNDVIVSPLYGVYVPKSVAHGRLIDLYFSSPSAAEKYLAPFVHRGAKNTMAITDEGFLAGEIPMPPTQEEADATGEMIEALDNEIERLSDYCGHLRLQKRGLMRKLLSGDWPVPASIDRLLPGGQKVDEAVGAEVRRAEATG